MDASASLFSALLLSRGLELCKGSRQPCPVNFLADHFVLRLATEVERARHFFREYDALEVCVFSVFFAFFPMIFSFHSYSISLRIFLSVSSVRSPVRGGGRPKK